MHGISLNDLIEAALRQQKYNHQRLGTQAKRYCDAITGWLCDDLPEDIREDVFQEAFAELFRVGPSGLAKLKGLALYRGMIFNAARIVRAAYAPPGVRTRKQQPDAKRLRKVAAEFIGQSASPADIARSTLLDRDGPYLDFDLFESPAAAAEMKQLDDRIDGEWTLRKAPREVAAALRLICFDGLRVDAAAKQVKMDRFKLYREVARFRSELAEAA